MTMSVNVTSHIREAVISTYAFLFEADDAYKAYITPMYQTQNMHAQVHTQIHAQVHAQNKVRRKVRVNNNEE